MTLTLHDITLHMVQHYVMQS